MGQDKGLLPFGEMQMVEFILGQLEGMGKDRFIISNRPQDYTKFGLRVYPDVIPGIGALGGFYTAMCYMRTKYALVLACDMPFINRDLYLYSLDLAENFDVVIPRLRADGFAEPYRGVYAKSCLVPIEQAIQSERRKVISFFPDVRVRYVETEEIHQFDPEERSFYNVNTPENLAQAKIMAGIQEKAE